VDLRSWIVTDHAAALGRFEQGIVPHVPVERWRERPGAAGSSIAWLLLHLAAHQDLAITTAIQGERPVLAEHRARLGLESAEPRAGLSEAEDVDVTGAIVLPELLPYAQAVHELTASWLETMDLHHLDDVVPSSERLDACAGVTEAAVPWLHRMWDGRTAGWLVQWVAIGHVHSHVGEMVSVRARLGLSPF
jgi:hypothetical protein